MKRTPWEIAEEWYKEASTVQGVFHQQNSLECIDKRIPDPSDHEAFGKWLCHQYRLAMAKGVQLGRESANDSEHT